ncbi:MAG TPA: hypothetical protein VJV79_02905 [Polyangiaceae bacterium]|nr:hypothetical protein [Polyangiaceae bacterium]
MSERKEPEVTLTLKLSSVLTLFAAGSNSFGSDPTPFDMVSDIVEHAAAELHMLHDALIGEPSNSEELASHAYRVSAQILAGLEIAKSLEKALGET